MRKHTYQRAVLLLSLVMLMLMLLPGMSRGAPERTEPEPTAMSFPLALRTIDDYAFYGTSLETAVFGERLAFIGEKAFLNIESLTDVYIPPSTGFIGRQAFPDGIVIHGVDGSYAQKWAAKNGIAFTVEDIWPARAASEVIYLRVILALLCSVLPPGSNPLLQKNRRRVEVFVKSMRPQDRTELYPINYRFP